MAGVSSGMSAASAAGLIQLGSDYDKRFRELNEQGDDGASAWPAFFEQLRDWLAACVQHGRFVPPGSADRRALQGQIDYWTSRLLQIGQSVRELDELERFDPNAGTPLPQELFPYYGLIAATEDSKHFFGRSEQIEEYASHLGERRSLLIQSESGGGKSSLAMAGVIPELRRRHPDWLFTPRITPGAHPQPALEKVLGVVLTQTTSMSTEAAMLAALGSRHLLIFIDQLEELLTLCTDESEQSEFCSLLASLAQSGHVRLLATLRSDHYDRLANSQACRSLFLLLIASNSVKMLLPMTFDQIRSVILKPAQAIGLRYIPASLVDRLANETANLAGGLPRLQFALQRLWELRPINDAGEGLDLINEATFAKLPSVREALATVAEGLFNSLLPNERNACQRLMLELTVLDDLLEVPLRRRRLEQDVIDILESAKFVDNAQGRDLVQKFIGQRLLLRTGSGQDAQLEVAHESLFRYWPRFQDWIRSDSTRVRLKDIRQIARDAQRWESAGGSADYLMLKGVPLEAARKYKEESWLDPASQRYYDACCSAEEQVKLLETKQASADQELKQARIAEGRAVALRKRVMRVAALICVLAGILTFVTLLWAHQVNLSQQAIVRAYAALPISNPLERLDLAYTLERDAPKRYASLLAQALDGLAGQELMGDRSTGIDFSTSGQALIQLFRIGNRLTVSIWPMEADGLHWPQPIKITVNESKEEQLFTVDVGPAMIAAKDKRFVVMWLVSQQSNSAPDRTFKKLVVYSVTK
ncbi:MAG: hypothetical protein OSB41_12880, partial [Kiritimatiellae bacterium]|nr:hypothetical protein [Kiritimatiellia bacterium]